MGDKTGDPSTPICAVPTPHTPISRSLLGGYSENSSRSLAWEEAIGIFRPVASP